MKILFITHETSRTGAPLMLLYFMEWIKVHHPETHLSVLSLREGALSNRFREVSDVFSEINHLQKTPQKKRLYAQLVYKLTKSRPHHVISQFLQSNNVEKIDVIYSNTVVTIPLAAQLKKQYEGALWVAHIHELHAIMQQLRPDFPRYIPDIDHCIAASEIVKNNLIQQWNVPENRVTRVYECSKITVVSNEKSANKSFVIGASGTAHWRKGSDLFVQVAMLVQRRYPEAHIQFVWVGTVSKNERIILEEDIRKCGLEKCVTFVGEIDTPAHYFNEFDIFLMTSREDPFPLVCIEVGMLGKPIITFKNAVGTSEIIGDNGGFVVPYLDVQAMTNAVTKYIEQPILIKEHGAFNKKAFTQFTPEIICPLYWQILTKGS